MQRVKRKQLPFFVFFLSTAISRPVSPSAQERLPEALDLQRSVRALREERCDFVKCFFFFSSPLPLDVPDGSDESLQSPLSVFVVVIVHFGRT